MFNEAWGVDVAVSTPRIMSALVEEAVTVGDLVRLFTFQQGEANMVELTLPDDSPFVGTPVARRALARRRVARGDRPRRPRPSRPTRTTTLEARDELLFVATADAEPDLEQLLSPNAHHGDGASE